MNELMPEIKTCTIPDSAIQYLHYNGEGPDLLLLHATGFTPWLWHPIARELARSFNIYAPYFCDHKFAEPEDGGLSWKVLAEDLFHFCGNLNLSNPYVAGHSMGATVISLCAAHHRVSPERMILIEPIFLPEAIYQANLTVDQHPLASKSIKRKNNWDSADEARVYLRSKKLFKNWDDEMIDLYIKHGMFISEADGLQLCCSPRREASLFMGSVVENPWPLIPEISCPVLVVEGEVSENRSYIDLKKAASLFPAGSYAEVKGAGHLVPMEYPEDVLKLMKDFFIK